MISKRIKSKNTIYFLIISVFLLVFFAVLAVCFPYTLDDWRWGTQVGLDRLHSLFKNYNGRYLGNFLILAISRSLPLKVVIMSLSFYFACVIPYLFSDSHRISVFILSALLFFVLPKAIFTQVVAWASGYTNYMPPILLSAVYMVIIKNIFCDQIPKYKKSTVVVVFFIAVAAGLFMENITLANVFLGSFIIFFSFLKFKKVFPVHISFLVGAILSTVIMFSNSVYGLIASDKDGYRSVTDVKNAASFINTVSDHLFDAEKQLFLNNIPVCFGATILCVLICFLFIKKSDNKKHTISGYTVAAINVVALLLVFFKSKTIDSATHSNNETILLSLIVGAYVCSLFLAIVFFVADRNSKYKQLFLLFLVPVLVAPLLVVNPINARCYYPPYFIMTILLVTQFDYIATQSKEDFDIIERAISPALLIIIEFFCVTFTAIYFPIGYYSQQSREYISKQVSNNESVIYVISFPNKDYLYGSVPGAAWQSAYKDFFGIPQEDDLIFLSHKEYSDFVSGYNSNSQSLKFVGTPKLISASTVADGVMVDWEAMDNAANYRVFYRTINGDGSWINAGDTTGTSYTVTGLNNGWSYWFTVRAMSTQSTNYTSNYDTADLKCQYVGAPKLVSVSTASNGATVNWEALKNVGKYRVFFKTTDSEWTTAGDTSDTFYTVTGLNTDRSYSFTVRAISADSLSYTSNYDTTGISWRYVDIPKLVSATTTANSITVEWEAPANAEKYRVFYKTASGSWTKAGDTTDTSYTVTSLNNGETYWFTVRAISNDGTSYTSYYDTIGLKATVE